MLWCVYRLPVRTNCWKKVWNGGAYGLFGMISVFRAALGGVSNAFWASSEVFCTNGKYCATTLKYAA